MKRPKEEDQAIARYMLNSRHEKRENKRLKGSFEKIVEGLMEILPPDKVANVVCDILRSTHYPELEKAGDKYLTAMTGVTESLDSLLAKALVRKLERGE